MKSFEEIINENKPLSLEDQTLIEAIMDLKFSELVEIPENLEESENYVDLNEIVAQYGDTKLKDIDEGIISKVLGGIAGFAIGPSIGKVIANALGIEKGIIYDMLTSRLVGAALGAAITKYVGGKR
jgi:hypothetical protein